MWSNQENRVRKQVKNPCEVVVYAMHSSGKNSLAVGLSTYKIAKIDAFTNSSQKISTHLLTVLTTGAILHIEQRNRHQYAGFIIRHRLCEARRRAYEYTEIYSEISSGSERA